jgi:GNAT superfamily N-acetyltransferase
VLGDRDGAIVLTVPEHRDASSAWIVLVAVLPERQGAGLGRDLVQAACARAAARGARRMHLANSVPRYLWPGVDIMNTRAGMLFESTGFERDLVGVNMCIVTSFRAAPPTDVAVERATSPRDIDFARRAFPHWVEELEVAIRNGTAVAARDASGATVGFGCHSCNRAGWIGPMATDPDCQHRGVGSAVLAGVCENLEDRGHTTGEISWVSNLRFYGKCGATVSRVFQGGHRRLP